jgi:hypothetical protein
MHARLSRNQERHQIFYPLWDLMAASLRRPYDEMMTKNLGVWLMRCE